MLIRDLDNDDLPAVQAIYAHWVLHGTGTFEIEPPDRAEMQRRAEDVRSKGYPYLVAEEAGEVIAYAYANWFRPRAAFRFCVEDSIYVAPGRQRTGIARFLLAELIMRCEVAGARQMIAVIGDSENHASIGLHRALGFTHSTTLIGTGWKHGRWLDTVIMQKTLGLGTQTDPA